MSDKQTSTNSATSTGATNEAAPAAPVHAAAPHASVKMAQAMPVRVQLFNASGATLSVPIINKATGETDVVFVQHGGKPKLLAGYTVDPVFSSRNPALQVTKANN
jgi:hypothetical protein